MIVRLVLEHEQPWLLAPVHVRRYAHGAGVYLLGLVEVLELARLFEVSGAKGGQLHEREGPVFPPQLAAQFEAALICGAHARVGDVGRVYDGAEGGVAAVVGPICIEDAQLGEAGVAALGAEVFAAALGVVGVHGEAHIGDEGLEAGAVEAGEAAEDGDVGGLGVVFREGGALFEGGLAAFDGVYEVALDAPELLG